MDSQAFDWHWARAALEWQLEMGADEAIGEMPVDRFAAEAEAQAARAAPVAATPQRSAPVKEVLPDPVEVAGDAA